MRKLERGHMGVEADGRQLHHLRFADDIVLITPSISQAEPMLTEFEETCGYIGLRLNLQKTMFMRNGWVSDALFTLNGTNIPKYHKEGHDGSHGVDLCVDATMRIKWRETGPCCPNHTSYVYPGRELNMMNDLTPEQDRGRRAAWGAYKSIEDVVKKTRNTRLRTHPFNTTCFDLCFGNLGISQAGRKRVERH
ncbi:hypothetical protein RB195_024248 [Necator americanus]|uniref:Reverse transcriptase domain-containing protein n=1 Tax=Necator americanus TaxID=51031 RepID=A0ABR1EME0_NECAM